jgi:hypothetical protein
VNHEFPGHSPSGQLSFPNLWVMFFLFWVIVCLFVGTHVLSMGHL